MDDTQRELLTIFMQNTKNRVLTNVSRLFIKILETKAIRKTLKIPSQWERQQSLMNFTEVFTLLQNENYV